MGIMKGKTERGYGNKEKKVLERKVWGWGVREKGISEGK